MAKRSKTWLDYNKRIRAHCNANGIDDDSRKDVILSVTDGRTDSLGACDDATMKRVLDRLQPGGGGGFRKSSKPYIRKIWALWGELKRQGALNAEDTDAALLTFANKEIKARQLDDVRQLDWLTYAEASSVIEALKAWVDRVKRKRGAQ